MWVAVEEVGVGCSRGGECYVEVGIFVDISYGLLLVWEGLP